MTKFDNHPPINFDNAEPLGCASRDGGCYNDIGHNRYEIRKGKRVHLTNHYSSGCSYNNRTDSTSTYIQGTDTVEDMIQYLLTQEPCWWVNSLLDDLGYNGAEA